jgi:S-DNA-T family DNA segregation ATPase FtsK/SpoIIIE
VSNQAGVSSTLELVERIRTTVGEFAGKEEALNQEFRLKIGSVQRLRDQEIEALKQQLPEALAREEASFREAQDRAKARHARRKSRIAQLHKTLNKRAAAWIEDKEGRRKHRLQTETLQSDKNKRTGIADTEKAYVDFSATLAAEQQALASFEEKARKSFVGYGSFGRLLTNPPSVSQPDVARDEYHLFDELRALLNTTEEDLRRFRKSLFTSLFRLLPLWLIAALIPVALVAILPSLGVQGFTSVHGGGVAGGLIVLSLVLHQVGRKQGLPIATRIAQSLARARRLHDVCAEKSTARRTSELERIENEFQAKSQWIAQEWDSTLEDAGAERRSLPQAVEAKAARAAETNHRLHRLQAERRDARHAAAVASLNEANAAKLREVAAAAAEREAKLTADLAARWQPIEAEWKTRIQPLYAEVEAANAASDKLFPIWTPEFCKGWSAPAAFAHAAKFARLDIDVPALAENAPKDPRLALPGPAKFPLPLLLEYPRQGSVLFETQNTGRDESLAAVNNIILRLLSIAPPGRLSFTVIDPVGLGQSFSGVMHLADYAEHVINSRIWTQTQQIEQRLADLNEHMEKVIQMYLRNDYETIADYNEQAGTIAEKYHFVVVADFPSNFSDLAARRLLSIATSGARCGVYTLIHWDKRQPAPQDFVPDELRKSSVAITAKGRDFAFAGNFISGATLALDEPPSVEIATDLIHKIGVSSRDSNRIEVPFSQITPAESDRWSLETTNELRVAIGRTGATKLQYLAMGKGTRQHGLVAGKTGSGKSTLFHVLITNLSLWCSPEQVEFYLIDFKKGVEFKCYGTHRLPHARVVAIESDREFGLSVLQRLDDELKRRGDLFRKLGVQDVAGYKKAGGTEPMPRTLLLIDEFQEFFVEDDKIAQTASLLLDRIVRQGRAFGIHALLGSQTLGGAYTMARTTLGQMVIRIALQCNEADAYLIMDDSNPAPRLLSRPGEGIYNDTAGTVEGNSPFQVVWLSDDERDAALAQVRQLADRTAGKNYAGPIVFEGNAPSEVRENPLLRALLEAPAVKPTLAPRMWLGAPNSIKGPTEVVFHRQSGNNLLFVGQRDEATLAIFSIGLVSLAAQFPRDGARIILCDGSAPGTPPREYLEKLVQAIPHNLTLAKAGDLPEIMKSLADEMARRSNDATAAEGPPAFLFLHGLQKFNKLRWEEDFGFSTPDPDAAPNPAVLLNNVICEGTRLGFHVIASCDTFNNLNRFLSRKAFSEFELRVLFQMSANDSASLIDSPKAGALGLHRALFYSAQEGHLETFRPYALPESAWIDEVAGKLSKLLG